MAVVPLSADERVELSRVRSFVAACNSNPGVADPKLEREQRARLALLQAFQDACRERSAGRKSLPGTTVDAEILETKYDAPKPRILPTSIYIPPSNPSGSVIGAYAQPLCAGKEKL